MSCVTCRRLREERDHACETARERRDLAYLANEEVTRLRAALERIDRESHDWGDIAIARSALASQPPLTLVEAEGKGR